MKLKWAATQRGLQSRSKSATRVCQIALLCFYCFFSGSQLNGAPEKTFIRGDVDSNSRINLLDAVAVFRTLFSAMSIPCEDSADIDDNGEIEISDGVGIMTYVFLQGKSPASPFPFCGLDVKEDELSCLGAVPCVQEQPSISSFFVIQRSSSVQEYLTSVINEVGNKLNLLSPTSDFAIVFFDRGFIRFPSDGSPLRATKENISIAKNWIATVPSGSATCELEGFIETLNISKKSTKDQKQVIYYGRGNGHCPGHNPPQGPSDRYLEKVLSAVKTNNTENTPFHCIGVGSEVNNSFMSKLSVLTGGSFKNFR